jgi:hypothetical protein
MGIDSGGSPGEVARFFRITRCPGVPAPSLIVRGGLGLVSAVSTWNSRDRIALTSPLSLIRPRTYEACELKKDDIIQVMTMTSRAIFSASWLSAAARRELSRFKEFMKWLRFGKRG